MAGSFSGFVSLFVFVPVDLLKCRAIMKVKEKCCYKEEITQLVKQDGIQGLYRGFWATALREVPSWGVYFATYDWLKKLSPKFGPDDELV